MKLGITEEWFEKRAALEGDHEIGVGRREFPPSYGGCRCMCHRSRMMHVVACCHPDDDFKDDPELKRLCEEIDRRKRRRS